MSHFRNPFEIRSGHVDLSNYDAARFDRGASALKEGLWLLVSLFLFRMCPLKLSSLKCAVLRLFGAVVGRGVVVKPGVRIAFPWRLALRDHVWLGEDCWILSLAPITIESHVCISQQAFLCTGSHDYKSPSFDLIVKPIAIERGAWVSAAAFVGPGVRIGTHAVLTANSVATKDLEPYGIYQGNPAVLIRKRAVGTGIDEASERLSLADNGLAKKHSVTRTGKSRAARYGAAVLGLMIFAGALHAPILRGVASFLMVEDPLQPAAAIIALGGQTPFREIEAAKLYHSGWAPVVIVVREARNSEARALDDLKIATGGAWELSRAVLLQQGVPADAIIVPQDEGIGTLEELQAAYKALESKDAPVILVTSKFHTRRTRLTWRHVTNDRSPPIARAAHGDPFDPSRWWQQRRFALWVAREYLGLMNYYAGFPVGVSSAAEMP